MEELRSFLKIIQARSKPAETIEMMDLDQVHTTSSLKRKGLSIRSVQGLIRLLETKTILSQGKSMDQDLVPTRCHLL